jgi:hypothetical protein
VTSFSFGKVGAVPSDGVKSADMPKCSTSPMKPVPKSSQRLSDKIKRERQRPVASRCHGQVRIGMLCELNSAERVSRDTVV